MPLLAAWFYSAIPSVLAGLELYYRVSGRRSIRTNSMSAEFATPVRQWPVPDAQHFATVSLEFPASFASGEFTAATPDSGIAGAYFCAVPSRSLITLLDLHPTADTSERLNTKQIRSIDVIPEHATGSHPCESISCRILSNLMRCQTRLNYRARMYHGNYSIVAIHEAKRV